MSQPTIEITVGIKLPGSVPFSIANAEIKKYLYDGDDFEAALDDVNDKLKEQISSALVLIEEKKVSQK